MNLFLSYSNYLRVKQLCASTLGYILVCVCFEHCFYYYLQDQELDRHLRTQGLNPDRCWRLKYGDFPTTEQTYSSSSSGVVSKLAKSKDVVSFIKLVLQNSKAVETMVLRLDGYLDATEYQKLLRMVPTFTRNKNVRTRGQAKRLFNVLKITP